MQNETDNESDEVTEERERTNKLVDEYGQAVCDAAAYVFGLSHWKDALEAGAYCGYHGSVRSYAESYIEDTGIMHRWDDLAVCYFDYEAFGRDLELDGDISEYAGHIFNNHW